MTTQYLPKPLRYFVNRVSGFSKNTLRFNPIYSGPWTQGQQIVCRFPANALIDVRSFAIKFDVTATCATSNSGTSVANNVIPPQHSSSFIERFELFANGTPLFLSGLSDYKSLAAIQQNLIAGGNKLTELSAFEGGSVATPTATTTFGTRTYVISNFLGMLAGTHCRYIPLNAIGQLELRWTLPPNSILSVFNAVNTGAAYSISNVQCYVDAISFDDGLFDGMLRQQLASGQPLIIPVKNYASFFGSTSSTTSNTTFQINTGSLDALYGTLRSQSYDAADSIYTHHHWAQRRPLFSHRTAQAHSSSGR